MDRVAAILLAGGRGMEFGPVSEHRTKAAFPVAGSYRIVDFVLTNLSHSGIRQVGIVIQYMPAPLLDHIGSGRPWEFDMADRSLRFMTPYVGVNETRWFRGTADAIAQNLNLLKLDGLRDILILSADHVYRMHYQKIVEHHRDTDADVTMAYQEIPPEEQHPRFGNLVLNGGGRVNTFLEKPGHPISPYVSIGIYCFKLKSLLELIEQSRPQDPEAQFSLAGNVLQPNIGRINAQSWRFDGPWYYLPDLKAYHEFHMEMARGRNELYRDEWTVMTNFSDRNLGWRPPIKMGMDARVEDCIVSPGCTIEGDVRGCVLSPGVTVGPGSVVRDSILFHDVIVGPGCQVGRAVVDKDVVLEQGSRVGGMPGEGATSESCPLTVIPKNFHLNENEVVSPGQKLYVTTLF